MSAPTNDTRAAHQHVANQFADDHEAADVALAAVDELAQLAGEVEEAQARAQAARDAVQAAQGALQQAREEAAAAQAEAEQLRLQLDAPSEEAAELAQTQDQLRRTAADFQNFRRRSEAQLAQATQMGQARLAGSLLDVIDDLGRTVEAAREAGPEGGEALREGVELVYRKFAETLAGFGVEPIEAVGQPFSEHEHEALMQQPAPEGTEPGTVLGEIQRGYRMGDRILRHARVIVAS